MSAPGVNAAIPAATTDDTPRPATVEVMASAGELDGILLAVAVPGSTYEAVTLTPAAAQQLATRLQDAVTHMTGPATDNPLRCTADRETIRAWLASSHGDSASYAQGIGIDEFFGVNDDNVHVHLTALFEASQRAGVFGVAGHTVELWHVSNEAGDYDGHLIVARRDDDTGLASNHIPVDLLIDPDQTDVDAAVSALENAAVIVNELLADPQHPLDPQAEARAPNPTPVRRAFPTPTVVGEPVTTTASISNPLSSSPRRSR